MFGNGNVVVMVVSFELVIFVILVFWFSGVVIGLGCYFLLFIGGDGYLFFFWV